MSDLIPHGGVVLESNMRGTYLGRWEIRVKGQFSELSVKQHYWLRLRMLEEYERT